MTEYDYAKVLEGLHDKILNDEEMLKKVDHPELYALGMCTSIFNRQKAEIERLQTNEQIATAVIAESSAEIERLKSDNDILSKNMHNLCKELDDEKLKNF